MSDRVDWHVDSSVIGLMFLSVSPGVSGRSSTIADDDQPIEKKRAICETLIIGVIGTMVTKSWWPLAGPILYLAYDAAWYTAKDRT